MYIYVWIVYTDFEILRCVVAAYNQTWLSAVPMEETTSMDWFSFITVMPED